MKVLLGRSAGVRVLGVGWLWLDSVFFVFDDGAVDRVRILSLCIIMPCSDDVYCLNITSNS